MPSPVKGLRMSNGGDFRKVHILLVDGVLEFLCASTSTLVSYSTATYTIHSKLEQHPVSDRLMSERYKGVSIKSPRGLCHVLILQCIACLLGFLYKGASLFP